MQNWKRFPRVILFLTLLMSFLAGMSAPSLENHSASAAPLGATTLDVVISEVAWAGTSGTYSSDEWIELYNKTNSTINLSGWTLAADDGDPSIALTGSIPANGYYLLEADDDTTISNIIADQIYSGTIGNSAGEILRLRDDLTTLIDTANSNSGVWDKGSGSSTYYSMERIMPAVTPDTWSDGTSVSYGLDAGGNQIKGTPHNSKIDLSLTMTASAPPSPIVGSTIVFTLTVTNNGAYNATNITVKDVFPTSGLNLTSAIGTGSYSSDIWTIGTLTPGASAILTMTSNVTDTGVKTNRAEIWTVDQFDPDSTPGNSIAEDDLAVSKVVVPVATSLNITNSVNNLNPIVGSNVVFTITVNNPLTNPYTATNTTVTTSLPAGLTYVSYFTASGSYNGSSGLWTIGNLVNNNSNVTLNITARVTSSNPLPYTVTVSSDEYLDGTATATINNPLTGEASLTLTHDPVVKSISVAGQVSLQIKLLNTGPDKATNVQVRDLLPAGLTFVSYSSTVGTYNSSTGIWAISEILNGADEILTINVKVDADGTSTKNFAEVWLSDQFDPNSTPGNGDAGELDDDSFEVAISDLRLTESVDIAGSNAVFTITVSNSGPDTATGVEVTTKLPSLTSAYTFVSYGSTQGSYVSGTGIWNVGSLADGASATLTITTTKSSSLLVNWVEVSASDQVDPDSVPGNISISKTEDDDASAPSADLFLTQSVNQANPDIGSNVIFTVTVENAGVAGTSGVQVKDLLPPGITFVSYTSTASTYSSSTGIWTVGDLINGGSKSLNITAKVEANGIKTNWAEVWKSNESDPDSTPGNASTIEDDDASATITTYRSVVINEVAWGGTAASVEDEWIELYNPSNAAISISGWTIKLGTACSSVTKLIDLSGTISAGGYFLIERGDNFTVSDIAADQPPTTWTALPDTGATLVLCDNTDKFIDTANKEGSTNPANPWPKGSNSTPFGTMERRGTTSENDQAWATNIGLPRNGLDANSGPIYGTPKKINSAGVLPTATPFVPVATVSPRVGRPIINEFLPRPGFDWNQNGKVDVFDEYIEIKNIGNADISLNGWILDDEAGQGSNPFTLPDVTLKVGERMIFYGLQTNILLSDGGDTVRLINASGKIYDAYTYKIAKVEDQSICRLPDGNGSWYEDCVPTPNLSNTRDGVVPSMPGGGVFQSPVCDLPDTLSADFLFAECRGYGANIWNSFYWDETGWQGDQRIPAHMNKWESFVE